MVSHQLKLHLWNTQRELPTTRQLCLGTDVCSCSQSTISSEREWVQETIGGWEVKWAALPEASQACWNYVDVDATTAAGSSANVSRPFYSVLLCVYVEDYGVCDHAERAPIDT